MNTRSFISAIALLAISSAFGQATAPDLDKAVSQARIEKMHPHSAPPSWMDFKRVQVGYDFLAKHQDFAEQVMATSSLAATFAAKDVEPVVMQTGRLPKDFQERMQETGQWMDSIFEVPKDQGDFVKKEYLRAVQLGQLHEQTAGMVAKDLKWNPRERVPMSGQAFSFVLYTFAWWPIEAMIVTGQVDPVKDAKDLDGWFHMWSVLGYGMGAPEVLLPKDFAQAKAIVTRLRQGQYLPKGSPTLDGIPILMRGHVRLVAAQMSRKTKKPIDEMIPEAATALANILALSPGELDALGLKPNPTDRLKEFAGLPDSKQR